MTNNLSINLIIWGLQYLNDQQSWITVIINCLIYRGKSTLLKIIFILIFNDGCQIILVRVSAFDKTWRKHMLEMTIHSFDWDLEFDIDYKTIKPHLQ